MNNKTELNRDYKEVLSTIRKIVNEIDPMNLFPECPEDEYDVEVSDILSGIVACENAEDLDLMVQKVFRKWFEEEIEISRFHNIGEKLLKIKMEYSWLNLK